MTAVAPDTTTVADEQPNGKRKRGAKTNAPAPTVPGFTPSDEAQVINVVMTDLAWSPLNPRKTFDDTGLAELAQSIAQRGLLQPIVVRNNPNYMAGIPGEVPFEGYLGERRYRAHKLLGAARIRAIVRDVSDVEMQRAMAVENLQRTDLGPMEEARAYRDLMADDPTLTIVGVAQVVSKEMSYVHRRLQLNKLPERAQQLLEERKLPFRAALEIARVESAEDVAAIMERYVEGALKHGWTPSADEIARACHATTLRLAQAPWSPKDATLLADAGSCLACPKRTGNAPTLFPDAQDVKDDRCTDRSCWQRKLVAFVEIRRGTAQKQAEKMGLPAVAISGEYGDRRRNHAEGTVYTRDHFATIPDEGPRSSACDATALGVVVESHPHANDFKIGTTHRVCTDPKCKVHRDADGARSGGDRSALEQKKRERQVHAECAVRAQALAQLARKVSVPRTLPPAEMRILAAHAVDRMYDHDRGPLCRQLNLEYVQHKDPTYQLARVVDGNHYVDSIRGAQAALRIHIDTLTPADLLRLCLRIALFGETQTHGSTDVREAVRIEALAKAYNVPVATMRKQAMDAWAADEKARAERRVAGEKRKKEKAARDAMKAAGQGDVAEQSAEKPERAKKAKPAT